MQTEFADWQPTHESGNTNTDLNMTQTAATQYTGSTLPANSTRRAAPVVTVSTNGLPSATTATS